MNLVLLQSAEFMDLRSDYVPEELQPQDPVTDQGVTVAFGT